MAIEKINFMYPKGTIQSVFDYEATTALELAAKTSHKVDECVDMVNGVQLIASEATAVVEEMKEAQEQFLTDNADTRSQLIEDNRIFIEGLTSDKTAFETSLNASIAEFTQQATNALNDTKTTIEQSATDFETTATSALNTFKNEITADKEDFKTTATNALNTFKTELTVDKNNFVDEANAVIENSSQQITNNVNSKVNELVTDGTIGDLINDTLLADINTNITEINDSIAEIDSDVTNIDSRVKNMVANVKDYGAKGDGVTDDTTAILACIAENREIIFPQGTYIMTQRIILGEWQSITSQSSVIGGCAMIKFTGTTKGVFLNGRASRVSNLQLYSVDNSGTAITLGESSSGNTNHLTRISNVMTYNFNIGIENMAVVWNVEISNVRINDPNYGIKFVSIGGGTNFCINFTNVYVDHAKVRNFDLSALKATFTGCNFSITTTLSFVIGVSSIITFNGCNFECDQTVQGNGDIFRISSYDVKFIGCMFIVDGVADVTFFATFSGMYNLSFENCDYKAKLSNAITQFFDKGSAGAGCYGAIKFLGGNFQLPRPDYYATQIPHWIDIEKGKPVCFSGTTIDKAKLTAGQQLYALSSKKMCYYDGANVIDYAGETIA